MANHNLDVSPATYKEVILVNGGPNYDTNAIIRDGKIRLNAFVRVCVC